MEIQREAINTKCQGASHFGGLHRRTKLIVRRNPPNVVRTQNAKGG